MSGSGGGGGGGFEPVDNCAGLVIDTQLSSPKPAVVARLQVGNILEVAVQATGGSSAVVVLADGQLAGGLASPEVGRLRECIRLGTQYVAVVTSRNEGQVRVRVKAK